MVQALGGKKVGSLHNVIRSNKFAMKMHQHLPGTDLQK